MQAALVSALACLTASLPASAAGPDQNNRRGAITGTVLGQTGRPLPGVKVAGTPTGAAGGPKTAYSDEKGAFRLEQLRFGTWEVRFTGADLKTLVRRGVLVATTVPTELRVVMEVEVGAIEEVRVLDSSPSPRDRRGWRPSSGGTKSTAVSRRCKKILRRALGRHASDGVDGGHVACWLQGRRLQAPSR